MSQLSTTPILKCKRCGRPLILSHLSTFVPDPDSTLLADLFKAAAENAYCEFHANQRAWFAQQGRAAEWDSGNT